MDRVGRQEPTVSVILPYEQTKGPEAIDVSIRCYLLGQAIDAALDQLDDEIPEAEDDNTEDAEDDADNIPA